jgi:hypothetical protein
MLKIAFYFWQMCLLRVGPDKVPTSLPIASMALAIYLAIAFISINVTRPSLTLGALVGSLLVGILIEVVLVYGILYFKKCVGRVIPTLTSLFGTNAIILLFLMVINLLLMKSDIPMLEMLAESAFWVIFFWWMAIVGFIFHRAMDISIFQGVAIAFTLELLTNIASQTFFPTPPLT